MDKNNTKTVLVQHSCQKKHRFDFDDVKILHRERNTTRRILEAIYISKNLNKTVNKGASCLK